MTRFEIAGGMGVNVDGGAARLARPSADLKAVNARVLGLASAQSHDIQARLEADGVRVCRGVGRVLAPGRVQLEGASGDSEELARRRPAGRHRRHARGPWPRPCPTVSAS